MNKIAITIDGSNGHIELSENAEDMITKTYMETFVKAAVNAYLSMSPPIVVNETWPKSFPFKPVN